MKIIKQQTLFTNPLDLVELDIINFNASRNYFENSRQAIEVISSWLIHRAKFAVYEFGNYYTVPKRDDWPGWNHRGNHPEEGKEYWNWFFYSYPNGELAFGDSPDFWGMLPCGSRLWGDIGVCTPLAFIEPLKQHRIGDTWVSVQGKRHIIIEWLLDNTSVINH